MHQTSNLLIIFEITITTKKLKAIQTNFIGHATDKEIQKNTLAIKITGSIKNHTLTIEKHSTIAILRIAFLSII